MGLTIFYSGQLRDIRQIPTLIEEVCDICDGLHWRCEVFEPSKDYPLYGVVFCAPGSEEIWLTFLSDGCLASPASLYDITGTRLMPAKDIVVDSIVQYAGPEAHMALIKMLRFLSKKYFKIFRVTDESEYWKSGDPEKCRDWFLMFDSWMKNMSEDLGKLDGRGYEDGRTYQERLKDLFCSGVTLDEYLKVMGDPFRKR